MQTIVYSRSLWRETHAFHGMSFSACRCVFETQHGFSLGAAWYGYYPIGDRFEGHSQSKAFYNPVEREISIPALGEPGFDRCFSTYNSSLFLQLRWAGL